LAARNTLHKKLHRGFISRTTKRAAQEQWIQELKDTIALVTLEREADVLFAQWLSSETPLPEELNYLPKPQVHEYAQLKELWSRLEYISASYQEVNLYTWGPRELEVNFHIQVKQPILFFYRYTGPFARDGQSNISLAVNDKMLFESGWDELSFFPEVLQELTQLLQTTLSTTTLMWMILLACDAQTSSDSGAGWEISDLLEAIDFDAPQQAPTPKSYARLNNNKPASFTIHLQQQLRSFDSRDKDGFKACVENIESQIAQLQLRRDADLLSSIWLGKRDIPSQPSSKMGFIQFPEPLPSGYRKELSRLWDTITYHSAVFREVGLGNFDPRHIGVEFSFGTDVYVEYEYLGPVSRTAVPFVELKADGKPLIETKSGLCIRYDTLEGLRNSLQLDIPTHILLTFLLIACEGRYGESGGGYREVKGILHQAQDALT